MANTGNWLGLYEGDWLGSVGATDPNAMYGSASFSITVTGTITNGSSVTPSDMVGYASFTISTTGTLSGETPRIGGDDAQFRIDHQTKRKKATIEDKPNQQLDEIIAKSFKQVFNKLTDKKAPKEVQKKANKIVSEYTEAYRPTFSEVDWAEFNRDLEAVQRLFALYNREFAENQKAISEKLLADLIENDNLEFLLMH